MMATVNETLDATIYPFSVHQRNLFMTIYAVSVFTLPLVLTHPQYILGTVVNTILVLSAMTLDFKRTLPAIVLPNIAAILGGYLFGGFTPALLLLAPLIWLGNASLVLGIKKFAIVDKHWYGTALGVAALIKTGIIFTGATILVSVGAVPAVVLAAMGTMQLMTALSGGILAYGIRMVAFRHSPA